MRNFKTKKYYIHFNKISLYSFYYYTYFYTRDYYSAIFPIDDKDLKYFKWANKFPNSNRGKLTKLETDQVKKDLFKMDKLVAFV